MAQESTSVSVKPDLSEGKCVIIARAVLQEDGDGFTWLILLLSRPKAGHHL